MSEHFATRRRLPSYSPRLAGGNRWMFNRSTNPHFPRRAGGNLAWARPAEREGHFGNRHTTCHTTHQTTHHTTCHKATFATRRVKDSSSRRNTGLGSEISPIVNYESGGRKWYFAPIRPHTGRLGLRQLARPAGGGYHPVCRH